MAIEGYRWKPLKEWFEEIPPLDAGTRIDEECPGFQGIFCALQMISTELAMMHDTVTIIHGPLSCSAAIRVYGLVDHANLFGNPFLHMPCTAMDNRQVVMGGSDNLAETIRAVDRDYRPSAIVVISSCAPVMIMDDVDAVIDMVQPEVGAKLQYIPSPGFVSPQIGQSIDLTVTRFVEMMDPPRNVDGEAVNILGQNKENFCTRSYLNGRGRGTGHRGHKKYPDDAMELARSIEALGLKLHRVLISGDYEYLRTAPEAAVNTFTCPTWGFPLARAMEEKFGTPYLRHAQPIGFEAMAKWVRSLGEFMGRQEEAEKHITEEYEAMEKDYEACKEASRGRVALMDSGRNGRASFARIMAYGRMMRELGMETYFFNLDPLELKGKREDVEYFLNDGCNPMFLAGSYSYGRSFGVNEIMKDLDLDEDQVLYFVEDIFPYNRAGIVDPSNVPRYFASINMRKVHGAPGRGLGFRGAHAAARDVLQGIRSARRKSRPTLYGRMHGKAFDF